METAVFAFLLLTLFTANQQHVVVERDMDVFFLDAGNLQRNLVLLVGLLDVQRRLQQARPVRRPAWHGQRRKAEASKRVVEEAVDLAVQLQDGTDGPTRYRQVIALHRQRGSALLFFLLLLEPVPGSQLLEINVHVTPPEQKLKTLAHSVCLRLWIARPGNTGCFADFGCSSVRITSFFLPTWI